MMPRRRCTRTAKSTSCSRLSCIHGKREVIVDPGSANRVPRWSDDWEDEEGERERQGSVSLLRKFVRRLCKQRRAECRIEEVRFLDDTVRPGLHC